jgi:hypothetical protein
MGDGALLVFHPGARVYQLEQTPFFKPAVQLLWSDFRHTSKRQPP